MKQIENYLAKLQGDVEAGLKSSATLRLYTKDVRKFEVYFALRTVEDIDKLTIDDYFEFYRETGLSSVSVNSLIRSLGVFHKYLAERELIKERHPFFKVKWGNTHFMPIKKKNKVVLTAEEETMLVNAGRNLQEMFMLAMMLKTALRRDEITKIKISDIDGCKIKITGKGGHEAYTYLDNNLCGMMSRYMSVERKTDSPPYLFYSTRGEKSSSGALTGTAINSRVKECALLAGISEEKAKKITAHRLRGTAITRTAIEKGEDVAQALARHKNRATTKIYIEAGDKLVQDLLLEGNK